MYNRKFYKSLKKPKITPPPEFFKVAWSILYVLMFLGFILVILTPDSVSRIKGICWFVVQFLVNVLWSPVFFVFEKPKAALFLSLLLVVFVGITVYFFAQVSLIAFSLLLPYWIWVCFACFLNWEIVVLNPEKRQ
ncbi:MAG: TspO/MBR family protein [bacterium]|nr:TspO/MBR family protein [bacterium]